MKNNRLFIIFAVLLLGVIAVWYFDSRRGDSSFDGSVIKIDSAAIDKIAIKLPGNPNEILLSKKDGMWMVASGDNLYKADTAIVPTILRQYSHLKADRLVARDPSKWKEYELTDSLAMRVTFYEAGETTADLMLGKFSYSQRPGSNPYGGGGYSVTTFVRRAGDKEILAVPDFLKSMFPTRPNDYRNKHLSHIDKNLALKIEFHYPADSSFVLQKNGHQWMIGDQPADSVAVERFVGSFSWLTGQDFLDGFKAPVAGEAPYSLTIELSTGEPVTFKAWPEGTSGNMAISSSAVKDDAWFRGNAGGLFKRIFERKESFVPRKEAKKK